MNQEEIKQILDELHLVRPEVLQPKAKKLFEAIMTIADERDELKEKIDTYENPKDLTLMFMYCDEKAKDKIKELENRIEKAIERIQLLIDIGFDYDGFNQSDSLKGLIDELVSYAKESRKILRGE